MKTLTLKAIKELSVPKHFDYMVEIKNKVIEQIRSGKSFRALDLPHSFEVCMGTNGQLICLSYLGYISHIDNNYNYPAGKSRTGKRHVAKKTKKKVNKY